MHSLIYTALHSYRSLLITTSIPCACVVHVLFTRHDNNKLFTCYDVNSLCMCCSRAVTSFNSTLMTFRGKITADVIWREISAGWGGGGVIYCRITRRSARTRSFHRPLCKRLGTVCTTRGRRRSRLGSHIHMHSRLLMVKNNRFKKIMIRTRIYEY